MSSSTQKKLAAIMFTHLVEYDEYNRTDENFAISLLKEHDAILSKIIKSYSGRIVKHMDNKIFAEFVSATDAVRCSINIHSTLRKTNSQNPDTFQMNVRIGIHMGEVYEKNKNLIPDNAKRIEDYRCNSPWRELIIRPDGEILPCCAFYGYEIPVGNIYKNSLRDIFQSQNLKKIRKEFKEGLYSLPTCKECSQSFYTLAKSTPES